MAAENHHSTNVDLAAIVHSRETKKLSKERLNVHTHIIGQF